MASKEIVSVLKIETGQSENTIKALKQEIAQLKKSLETAEIGSEEFAQASRDLATAQANLKTVMADGKKAIDAAEGSYNHMVATMAELKKAWRATADEAKRNEIGQKIDEINTKLKEMDASIGNHQRNVGNYKGDIIEAFDEMGGGAISYGDALAEVNKSTEVSRGALDGVGKMASGVAGGFAALQGVMALCGAEGGNFEKVMVKLTAAMAIAQGIGGLKGVIEGFGQLKTAFTACSMGGKTLTTTLGGLSGGLIAAVGAFAAVAVGAIALAGNMSTLKQKFTDLSEADKAAKKMAKLNTELTELTAQSSAEKIIRVKELSAAYRGLGDDLSAKEQFVTDFKDELSNMGIEMNNVNDADNIFIENTDDYIKALMLRAKALAIKDKAQEDYAKFLVEEAKLEEKLADAVAKRNAGTPDKTFWQNIGEALIGASVSEGAPVDVVQDFNDDWTAEIAEKAVTEATQALTDARNNADAAMEEAFRKAGEFDKQADALIGTTSGTTSGTTTSGGNKGGGSSGNNNANAELEEAKRIARESRIALLSEKEKELKILETNYLQRKALLEKHHIDTTALTEVYNNDILAINDKYRKIEEEKETQKQNFLRDLKIDMLDGEEQELAKLDAIFEEYKTKYQFSKEELLLIDEWYESEKEAIRKKYAKKEEEDNKEKEEKYKTFYAWLEEKTSEEFSNAAQASVATLSSVANMLSSISSMIDQTNEDGFEKAKKLQKASVWIATAQGIINAIASAWQLGPILGPIVGGINAAATLATGIAQVNNINKQKYNGDSPLGGGGNLNGAGATPNVSMESLIPINYTKELMTDTETTEMNKGNRVYVVESDISNTQKNVEVKETNSSF